MNPESANALLKTLEEPSDGVIMILVSSNILQLLPTIISRCQSVKFSRLSRELTEKTLVDKFKINSDVAKLAANLSDGSLGMAKMLSDESFMKSRQILYALLAEHQPSDVKHIFTLVEQSEVPTDTEIIIFYNWVLFWLRDILVYRITKDESLIINSDFRSEITNISSKWSWTAIRSAIQRLEYLDFVMREKFINSPFTLETVLLRAWQATS
jgi:DNA polymerase III subunit delta'